MQELVHELLQPVRAILEQHPQGVVLAVPVMFDPVGDARKEWYPETSFRYSCFQQGADFHSLASAGAG